MHKLFLARRETAILRDMEELLIEDKKYVSSKRAAKMTGYAKDYVGQLCREGRVPARLVGRSWYVLESAIHDHRFAPAAEVKSEKPSVFSDTWESPRYEAADTESLPPVNRLEPAPVPKEETADMSRHLQDSWKAWFDRVSVEPAAAVASEEEEKTVEETREMPLGEEKEEIKPEVSTNVPIRAIYERPPEDLTPRRAAMHAPAVHIAEEEAYAAEYAPHTGSRTFVRTLQMAGAACALLAVVLAGIGSGYFDNYVLSSRPAGLMAGVILYNK
jgi:hypothetical protein